MHRLSNEDLEIGIDPTGAELHHIRSVKNGKEFMWSGDPEIWSGHAPNLFPIVGALKDETYLVDNEEFQLPRHGFVRHNHVFKVVEQNVQEIKFQLQYSDKTLKSYPYKFLYEVSYKINGNRILVTYDVTNLDVKTIYFSLGAHPAFKCPIYSEENYSDYLLRFPEQENSKTHLINPETGLFTSKTESVFDTDTTIALTPHIFDQDALVFKDLRSNAVSLESKNHGRILTVYFKDFPYLGIWAKPNANFVCIEPWHGLADSENTDQVFKNKEGIIGLKQNNSFNAAYEIEIDPLHLG